jgi:hypothetical protein
MLIQFQLPREIYYNFCFMATNNSLKYKFWIHFKTVAGSLWPTSSSFRWFQAVLSMRGPEGCIASWDPTIATLVPEQYTVKWGNVVAFFAQNHIFLRILFRWPNVIYCYKIQFKKFIDVDMTIFGFCHHLGHLKKMLGWRHYNVVTSLCSGLSDNLSSCG